MPNIFRRPDLLILLGLVLVVAAALVGLHGVADLVCIIVGLALVEPVESLIRRRLLPEAGLAAMLLALTLCVVFIAIPMLKLVQWYLQ
jgi:membrane-bound ClpP family serine protease